MGKIISIVSGKGGCGKSLLTAILGRALAREGLNVLMIDMDIFVRGLTILLKTFKKSSFQKNKLSVNDIIMCSPKHIKDDIQYDDLLIERFYECDVIPSVSNIGAQFEFESDNLSKKDFNTLRINRLIETVKDRYDYILLDNRAGIDSLICASSITADIILSIAEDDEISRQTNTNLINFFKYRKKLHNVYTIINKARNISSFKELTAKQTERPEFSYIGVIPFDMEVLNRFGTERFWYVVNETLYFRAIIECWNNLKSNENIDEISVNKYNFPPRIFMNKGQGRFQLIERMSIIYSITFILGGLGIWLYSRFTIQEISKFDLMSIGLIVLGVFTFMFSVSSFFTKLIKSQQE